MALGAILNQQFDKTNMPVCYFSKWLNIWKNGGVFISMRCTPLSKLWASGDSI